MVFLGGERENLFLFSPLLFTLVVLKTRRKRENDYNNFYFFSFVYGESTGAAVKQQPNEYIPRTHATKELSKSRCSMWLSLCV